MRAKVYSLEMISEKDHDDILASAEGSFEVPSFKKTHLKRCKGVKRHLLRQKVLHKHFRASVEDKKNKMVDFLSSTSSVSPELLRVILYRHLLSCSNNIMKE